MRSGLDLDDVAGRRVRLEELKTETHRLRAECALACNDFQMTQALFSAYFVSTRTPGLTAVAVPVGAVQS
jgi:hypothetical protein